MKVGVTNEIGTKLLFKVILSEHKDGNGATRKALCYATNASQAEMKSESDYGMYAESSQVVDDMVMR